MHGAGWAWLGLITACGATTTRGPDDLAVGGSASGHAGAAGSAGVATTGGTAGSPVQEIPEPKSCDAEVSVPIPDPVLNARVRTAARLPLSGPIALADVEALDFLEVEEGVASLDGLECFKGLEALGIRGGTFDDLRPISGLPLLRTLSLTNGRVSDLSALAALKRLDWLYLDRNEVVDVAPLTLLPKIFNLSLLNNQVRDVTPLLRLPDLGELLVDGNPIDCADPTQRAALAELQYRITKHPPPAPHPEEPAARGFYGPCTP